MTAASRRSRIWCRLALAGVSACMLMAGCSRGPQVGMVRGTVTYRGRPLAGMEVSFDPVAGGRRSTGTTDAAGGYELRYTRDRKGALVGSHEVRVNWPVQTAADLQKRDAYPIPAAFNTATTLSFDVKRGSNTFDVRIDPR
jgi:hypothetical protein